MKFYLKLVYHFLNNLIKLCMFKIHDAADDNSIREMALASSDLLLDCGYVKPLCNLTMKDKSDLIHTVTLHKVVLSVLGELNQFRCGIDSTGLNIYESIEKYYDLCAPFYCLDTENQLTSGMMLAINSACV